MSIESVAKALNVDGLSPVQRLVLIGIANHDGDGGAWPSIATLARYACCSTRHVRNTIRELESMDLVSTARNEGGTSSTPSDRRPNLYRLNMTGGNPSSSRGGNSATQRGEPQFRAGGNPSSSEPSLEPSWKPRPDPVDDITSVDDMPEGPLKDRVQATVAKGTGHER